MENEDDGEHQQTPDNTPTEEMKEEDAWLNMNTTMSDKVFQELKEHAASGEAPSGRSALGQRFHMASIQVHVLTTKPAI